MHISSRKAFTLIELLVVIGLISVLAAVLGLSLGRGNSGAALQSSQSVFSALVGGARGQAAVASVDAAVVVNVTPASENFLREFYLVVITGTDSAPIWTARGDSVLLPQGIHLVPANGAFPTTNVDYSPTGGWTINRRSTNFTGATTRVRALNGSNLSSDNFRIVARITPLGTRGSNSLSTVVFSPAERTGATSIVFSDSNAIRGLSLSTYGVATLLNDATSFDP